MCGGEFQSGAILAQSKRNMGIMLVSIVGHNMQTTTCLLSLIYVRPHNSRVGLGEFTLHRV